MLRLGAHESIAGGLHRALERAASVGCESMQMWVKSSRQWTAPPLEEAEIAAFKAAEAETDIRPVVAHAAYLINIASPKDGLRKRSVASLIAEATRCEQLGIPYLVLHPGAHTGAGVDEGIRLAALSLGEVHAATEGFHLTILLETMAGQGTVLGRTFEELRAIIEATAQGERLGVCFDTCHVFAAGYELRTPEGYEATMEAFAAALGFERLKVIHLNDSRHPLGSRKDRHEHIGHGYLGEAPFRHLLHDIRLDGLPGILETPKSADLHEDRENLATLRRLAKEAR